MVDDAETIEVQKLPPNWVHLRPDEALKFEAELRREMCAEHVLYGTKAAAVARRSGFDDFLFQVPDRFYAEVHLTWRPEKNPDYPWTTFCFDGRLVRMAADTARAGIMTPPPLRLQIALVSKVFEREGGAESQLVQGIREGVHLVIELAARE